MKECQFCTEPFEPVSPLGRARKLGANPRKKYCSRKCGQAAAMRAYCIRVARSVKGGPRPV